MQFGASGSTVHGPVETVKYCEFGARGGGGERGGGGGARGGGGERGGGGGARGGGGAIGGKGGGGGGGGFEHTRQPVETPELSEVHVIEPVPNTMEGPTSPLKGTSVPAVFGKLSLSQHASVEKFVAVMKLPMASEVGVMEHVWLMA